MTDGLTSDEARRRLGAVGPNEPARRRRGAALAELLGFLANPLVVILLVASLVSAIVGDGVNAAIIVVMVVLSVVLNFVQTHRSRRAAERLRDEAGPAQPCGATARGPRSRGARWCPATSSGSRQATASPRMRSSWRPATCTSRRRR